MRGNGHLPRLRPSDNAAKKSKPKMTDSRASMSVSMDGRSIGAAARHLPCEPCDGLSFFFEFGADEAADV